MSLIYFLNIAHELRDILYNNYYNSFTRLSEKRKSRTCKFVNADDGVKSQFQFYNCTVKFVVHHKYNHINPYVFHTTIYKVLTDLEGHCLSPCLLISR